MRNNDSEFEYGRRLLDREDFGKYLGSSDGSGTVSELKDLKSKVDDPCSEGGIFSIAVGGLLSLIGGPLGSLGSLLGPALCSLFGSTAGRKKIYKDVQDCLLQTNDPKVLAFFGIGSDAQLDQAYDAAVSSEEGYKPGGFPSVGLFRISWANEWLKTYSNAEFKEFPNYSFRAQYNPVAVGSKWNVREKYIIQDEEEKKVFLMMFSAAFSYSYTNYPEDGYSAAIARAVEMLQPQIAFVATFKNRLISTAMGGEIRKLFDADISSRAIPFKEKEALVERYFDKKNAEIQNKWENSKKRAQNALNQGSQIVPGAYAPSLTQWNQGTPYEEDFKNFTKGIAFGMEIESFLETCVDEGKIRYLRENSPKTYNQAMQNPEFRQYANEIAIVQGKKSATGLLLAAAAVGVLGYFATRKKK